jgi:hypothetical protein
MRVDAREIVGVLDADASRDNRSFESGGVVAGIASDFRCLRQRRAVRLLDVLSRDSAS